MESWGFLETCCFYELGFDLASLEVNTPKSSNKILGKVNQSEAEHKIKLLHSVTERKIILFNKKTLTFLMSVY